MFDVRSSGQDKNRTLVERSTSLPKALVAAIGVGVAFGAGFVVGGIGDAHADNGKGASNSAVVDVDGDPIAAAQARTKAYEERMKDVTLTWHQELQAVDAVAKVALPASSPTSTSSAKPSVSSATAVTEEPSSAPVVDKAVVQAPDEPAPAPKKVAAKPVDEDDDDDGTKKVKSKPNLDAAIGKVLGEKPAAAAAEKSSSTEKRYALQLGSTATEAAAKVLAEGWAARGQKVSVVAADVAGKGTVYRVRVGGIASRAAADALKAKLGQGLVVAD